MTIHHSDIQLILAQQAQHRADWEREQQLLTAGFQPLPSTNLGPRILMFDPAEATRQIRRRAAGAREKCSGRPPFQDYAQDIANMAIARVEQIVSGGSS